MSNVVNAGINGGGGGMPLDEVPGVIMEEHGPSAMQGNPMPKSEEEADAMLRQQLDNNPERMRFAAREFAAKLNAMADAIDGGAAATQQPQPSTPTQPTTSPTPAQPTPTPVQAPAQAAAPVAPPQPRVTELPTGYMQMPEHLYRWSPDSWGGRVLHGVPDLLVEREGRSKTLILVLVAPAFGRNRAGRIVSLPEGARVAVEVSIAWAAIVPLAKSSMGRPVVFAVPTTIDPRTGRVRPANPGDPLHRYETGDGGYEYGMLLLYDPDPRDPSRPRLISIETLQGARQDGAPQAGGEA